MKINKKLNLVIPVEREGGTLYVHSMPIGRETFDRYYMTIAKTFAGIYMSGLGWQIGPRVAMKVLCDSARDLGVWDTPDGSAEPGVRDGLVAEMKRLTNVIVSGQSPIPYVEAVKRKVLDDDEVDEIENALAFFIVASSMHRKDEIEAVLEGASKIWGGQTTSLNCTEYAASLKTSTPVAATGETAKRSSIPY